MTKLEPLSKNRNWARVHKWLSYHFGKANHCEFCGKTEGNFNWAKKADCEYEKNVNNFYQLCVSCHRKYDCTPEIREARSKAFKGRLMTRNLLKPIKMLKDGKVVAVYESTTIAAKENNILRTAITNCLTGRSFQAGGYKWEFLKSEGITE